MQAKVVHPLFKLVWGAEGEARDKAVFLVEKDLGRSDDHAFDWGVEDDLSGVYRDWETDRKSTRLNSSHRSLSRMPSSA